ncbi:c-type cytochrome [Pseudomonas cannabina]|uniref:Cytochrome c2 n=3 Tax=Pseudomonas syringae group TaxID=136849 RepID=A0A3M3PV05_PSECA|nr:MULTISPECIES: c-type cytochrome [Pseudomonas syringae group]KPB68817.1 Cytochrome c2 [Pseudomonas syringae pv. maculicola]KPW26909.1 Cytochrome c2 [Pseudomonas cannabina pv. alisalensis]MBM0139406.1 c-type cytochrome [Pseudomonas cannabina pv. alisalensis]QHE96541.1 c-type cytochrome [Pseudomonas syringae pv. maculicola str. ES4326]QQN20403.1 c-type cytochrome [Pseudomonas cannabina pv. alisalensis]
MKKTALFALVMALHVSAYGAGDAEAGKAVFTRLCSGCHKIGPSARHAFGPQLNGIVGQQAGQQEGYVYTDAMKNSGLIWNREELRTYIKDPSDVVPGTRMKLWWMGNDERMDDLLEYLDANK